MPVLTFLLYFLGLGFFSVVGAAVVPVVGEPVVPVVGVPVVPVPVVPVPVDSVRVELDWAQLCPCTQHGKMTKVKKRVNLIMKICRCCGETVFYVP